MDPSHHRVWLTAAGVTVTSATQLLHISHSLWARVIGRESTTAPSARVLIVAGHTVSHVAVLRPLMCPVARKRVALMLRQIGEFQHNWWVGPDSESAEGFDRRLCGAKRLKDGVGFDRRLCGAKRLKDGVGPEDEVIRIDQGVP